MSDTSKPFITCEDALPDVLGLFNFYATLTSVPLFGVPLSNLAAALRLSIVRSIEPVLHASLVFWLAVFTLLFVTNLLQHATGNLVWIHAHEILSSVQGIWHASALNVLRRRTDLACVDARTGILAASIATAAVLSLVSVGGHHDDDDEDDADGRRKAALGLIDALCGPYIVYTHGRLAFHDPRAWRLFRRSCAGVVLVVTLTGPSGLDSRICRSLGQSSVLYHALVDHGVIWFTLGAIAANAVYLVDRTVRESNEKRT